MLEHAMQTSALSATVGTMTISESIDIHAHDYDQIFRLLRVCVDRSAIPTR